MKKTLFIAAYLFIAACQNETPEALELQSIEVYSTANIAAAWEAKAAAQEMEAADWEAQAARIGQNSTRAAFALNMASSARERAAKYRDSAAVGRKISLEKALHEALNMQDSWGEARERVADARTAEARARDSAARANASQVRAASNTASLSFKAQSEAEMQEMIARAWEADAVAYKAEKLLEAERNARNKASRARFSWEAAMPWASNALRIPAYSPAAGRAWKAVAAAWMEYEAHFITKQAVEIANARVSGANARASETAARVLEAEAEAAFWESAVQAWEAIIQEYDEGPE